MVRAAADLVPQEAFKLARPAALKPAVLMEHGVLAPEALIIYVIPNSSV
jgi:hypothetical protein